MSGSILGLHHITAICSDIQRTLDFYTGVLGLRLVKKTINFDDPDSYHLYFGDEVGNPGTLITFFHWPGRSAGRAGAGQAVSAGFTVPEGTLDYWKQRLAHFDVPHEEPATVLDNSVLRLRDPDGLRLELVGHGSAESVFIWDGSPVEASHAIQSLHNVALQVNQTMDTRDLLTTSMAFRPVVEENGRQRLECGEGGPSTYIDLLDDPFAGRGHVSSGCIHHVAIRMSDRHDQMHWRERLIGRRLQVSPVRDRDYFTSIYFREPEGVLMELATDAPGFMIDEPREALGGKLKIPDRHQSQKERIKAALPPLKTPDPSQYQLA